MLLRKDSPSSTRLQRGARDPCFAHTARGPGPLSTMLSAAIAIANAVQFSACSGVLRVLGLARAGPGDIALRVFWPATPNMELWAAPRFVLTEGGRECGEKKPR